MSEDTFLEPDLVLAPRRRDLGASPCAAVTLEIKIADRAKRWDLTGKAALHADYGAPEYWGGDAVSRAVTVQVGPLGPSGFAEAAIFDEIHAFAPRFAPTVALTTAGLD